MVLVLKVGNQKDLTLEREVWIFDRRRAAKKDVDTVGMCLPTEL
jgi:hypothetical protein